MMNSMVVLITVRVETTAEKDTTEADTEVSTTVNTTDNTSRILSRALLTHLLIRKALTSMHSWNVQSTITSKLTAFALKDALSQPSVSTGKQLLSASRRELRMSASLLNAPLKLLHSMLNVSHTATKTSFSENLIKSFSSFIIT